MNAGDMMNVSSDRESRSRDETDRDERYTMEQTERKARERETVNDRLMIGSVDAGEMVTAECRTTALIKMAEQ